MQRVANPTNVDSRILGSHSSSQSKDSWDLSGRVWYLDSHQGYVSRGSHAVVYMGEAWIPDQPVPTIKQVAIKRLIVRSIDESVEKICKRLHREAYVWSQLPRNQHIARFLGYVMDERGGDLHANLVSLWYSNGDIEKYLSAYPEADRENLCVDVVSGLKCLHENSPPIVHGDLKPNNILVNHAGQAVLCDFGMSTTLDFKSPGFSPSSIAGAIQYLAPELVETDERTLEGDIYAFGCILLKVLYKLNPYGGKHQNSVFRGLLRDDPERPHYFTEDDPIPQTRGVTSSQLRCLLEQCWSSDPAGRPNISGIHRALPSPFSVLKANLIALMATDPIARLSQTVVNRWLETSPLLLPDEDFCDALCSASRHASLSAVTLLLHGCRSLPTAVASEALYCLVAASGSHPETGTDSIAILHLLVRAGADPRCPTFREANCFDAALELPSAKKYSLTQVVTSSTPLLCIAIHHGNIPLVSALLELLTTSPYNVQLRSDTLIIAATRPESGKLVTLLSTYGAPPNELLRIKNRGQPLSAVAVAAYRGDFTAIRALLLAGADINARECRTPPLYWAVSRRNQGMVSLMLRNHADVNFGGAANNRIPLHKALKNGDTEISQSLLGAKADPSLTDSSGWHAPFHVLDPDHLNLLMALDRPPNLNHPDKSGTTPLHNAMRRQQYSLAARLILFGASVPQGRDRTTVLEELSNAPITLNSVEISTRETEIRRPSPQHQTAQRPRENRPRNTRGTRRTHPFHTSGQLSSSASEAGTGWTGFMRNGALDLLHGLDPFNH